MQSQVTLTSRGAITIPVKLREAMGMRPNDTLVLETTDQGLLIRPSVSVPIELYSEERIAEFSEDDFAIGQLLDSRE